MLATDAHTFFPSLSAYLAIATMTLCRASLDCANFDAGFVLPSYQRSGTCSKTAINGPIGGLVGLGSALLTPHRHYQVRRVPSVAPARPPLPSRPHPHQSR